MTRLADDPESKFEVSLISRIADGDESAFAALYQRLSSSLYGLAYRMMNDAKEAEDVLQEGFTYIWRKAGSYDPTRSTPFAGHPIRQADTAAPNPVFARRSCFLLQEIPQFQKASADSCLDRPERFSESISYFLVR